MKDLGFKKVRIYDSSWLGYGNTLDAPADNVTFFNVGALNGRLAGMQKRIDALEKQVAEAKAPVAGSK
jgi:thiosulfate/3-mercaptopyruvate sulfurtransferase